MKEKNKSVKSSDTNITIKKISLSIDVPANLDDKKSDFIELNPKLKISNDSKESLPEKAILKPSSIEQKIALSVSEKSAQVKLKKITINDFTPQGLTNSTKSNTQIKDNSKDIISEELKYPHKLELISYTKNKPVLEESIDAKDVSLITEELPLVLPQELPTTSVITSIKQTPKIPIIEDINELLLELNKKTKALIEDETIIERFSFLGDTPVVGRISYKTYNVKHLYSKIDDISKKTELNIDKLTNDISSGTNNSVSGSIESKGIFEELNIPEMIAIKDNIVDIDNLVLDKFSSVNEFNLSKSEDIKISPFISTASGPKLNEIVSANINRIQLAKANKDLENNKNNTVKTYIPVMVSDGAYSIAQKQSQEKQILNSENKSINQATSIAPESFSNITTGNSLLDEPVIASPKEMHIDKTQEKSISYIMPIDASKNPNSEFVRQDTHNINTRSHKSDLNKMPALVYSAPIFVNLVDIKKTYEKYSLDDFTYVTISYVKDKGLFYNLVQPELNMEQEKIFSEIKKIFFNTIDQNFYTFKGDRYNLELYTKKIFDISISKLSLPINSLDKQLYYKFIQREFSGLGLLTALLSDKKILEVSCAGEKTSITVYHVNYGTLETNINFDSLQKLNQFVMILTKNMGLYVNSAHPIIEGYLPNGYKVEGIYSVGELSSRGSSFIIRKYLDEPITPVALVNNGIGAIDIFAYIWCAIKQDYKIILTGDNDSFMILNSIALFYPDKKIISIQSYDRLKLPQKEWIKRIFTGYSEIDKKTIIQHTISERPDYIVVDDFSKDLFEVPWYSVNLFYVNFYLISQLKEQIKLMSQKAIIINLRRIKTEINENIQITKIDEFNDKSEFTVVEMIPAENAYNLNLLSSSIDIVEFNKKKKYIRWLKDTKIYDYRDFNNIINEFSINEEKVVKRLGIDIVN